MRQITGLHRMPMRGPISELPMRQITASAPPTARFSIFLAAYAADNEAPPSVSQLGIF